MIAVGVNAASPATRLVAQGRILAGFLTAESATRLPSFAQAPAAVRTRIQSLFGERPSPGNPVSSTFRHVDEPDALSVVAVAVLSTPQATLSNLVGFEWIRIDSIVAGHYLAAPMPEPERCPAVTASAGQIAEFCVGGGRIGPKDFVRVDGLGFVSPEPLRFQPQGIRFEGSMLSVDYQIVRPTSPVTVLAIDHRVIAVKHLARLVALQDRGVQEALCLVCYGYGTHVLTMLPTIETEALNAERPPLISDFSNNDVAVSIPVHTPRTVVKFSHDVTDLAPVA
jgi:hypothetical protein